jgi:hypothetical protein
MIDEFVIDDDDANDDASARAFGAFLSSLREKKCLGFMYVTPNKF